MILNRFVDEFSKRDCGSLGTARLPLAQSDGFDTRDQDRLQHLLFF